MAHGQKKKSLTLRAPSGTGRRKGAKSMSSTVPPDENANPLGTPAIPSQPRLRPKPRPIVPRPANVDDATGGNEAAAACALVSLKTCTNTFSPTSPPDHHYPRRTIEPSISLEGLDEDAEEEEHDELEDEVDELEDDDSDSDASGTLDIHPSVCF